MSVVSVLFPSLLQWFGFYKSGQAKETIPVQESTIYKEVREGAIGLGRLTLFLSSALAPGAAGPSLRKDLALFVLEHS